MGGQRVTVAFSDPNNKEIARQLYLSVHTVQRHVANIYAKIGVPNRAEATAYTLHIGAET